MVAPVETTGLGKDYNGFPALKSLDLVVEEGVCFGYLGPNGAGKTTTIKILTNLMHPSRGRASIFGHNVNGEPRDALYRVGALVETPEFYGFLTPHETLAYAGRLRGMASRDIAARTEEVLREVKLSEWVDRRIDKFSKGMKQRLALAQALLHDPDLLVLDEPTTGLDPRGRVEVREIIKDLKRKGHTIFMSSHLLSEVQEVCDEVGLLNHGELLIKGNVRKLARTAKHSTIEVTFLGSASDQDLVWLQKQPGVVTLERGDDATVELQVEGEASDLADLLRAMVEHGLRVTSYRALRTPLEQLYMDYIAESR